MQEWRAAYILTETSEADAAAALDVLREIMEVGEISLIDQSGEIFLSTDDSLPGSMADQELMEEMQCSRFLLREAAVGRSGGEPGLITEGI